jgi:transmembrane sensor
MMATEPQSPIDDALLGKYLAGEASQPEVERVRHWLTRPANQREFDRFTRIWNTAADLNRPDTVNTEAAWQRVKTQMHRSPKAAPADTSVRPLTDPTPKRANDWRFYGRIAAMLTLAVLAGVSVWRFTRSGESLNAVARLSASSSNTTRRLTLPDGSQVLLNRHSRLTYPATFTDSTRDVALTGEAFFEVAHDPRHPFRVRAGGAVVRVLGTSFNVRTAGDSVQVAVRTGKVQLAAPRQAVVLTPNQQATYLATTDTIRRPVPLNANRLAYQTGQLSFTNTSLAEVVQTLRDVYDIDIRLSTPALGRCRLTADFGKESIDAILAVVAETLSLTVQREGEARILTGTGCE